MSNPSLEIPYTIGFFQMQATWCNKTLPPKDNGENSENGRKWNNLAGHSRVLLLSVAPDTHLSLQAANNNLKSPAKLQIWHTMKTYAL